VPQPRDARRDAAQRRRPERFFFLRGDGGGGRFGPPSVLPLPPSELTFVALEERDPRSFFFAGRVLSTPFSDAGLPRSPTAARAPAAAGFPPPTGTGSGGGRNLRMKSCCPMVQVFVVIQ
jgi:hypothetical protein